ncbi:uncharacterized protein LOC132716032 isoform X2 [Ruditapes philippinarum]|uniref:uncharacterized protein LOC132716032 isoform X2 n=1 Tax=Ruditapes philippinarum TaxID=129788 RepID=UPI00295B2E16|nr:uncharacterized protein LOC132716032 isoform X2 [Ruditapes philippinarum]
MEENVRINTRQLDKNTYKDILISPNNDDIIIPISATFDRVALHIGIGNGRGIFIEKPDVKDGKEIKTSVKRATQKFMKRMYKGIAKNENAIESKLEELRKPLVEDEDKFIGDISNRHDIDRYLLRYVYSFYGKTISKAAKGLSKNGLLLRQAQSEDVRSVIDSMHAALEMEMVSIPGIRNISLLKPKQDFKGPTVPNMNIDMKLYSRPNYSFNATNAAVSLDRQSLDTIDIDYQNEMLAILIDAETGISRAFLNFLTPEFQIGSFSINANDTNFEEDFEKSMQDSQMFSEVTLLTIKGQEQNYKGARQKLRERRQKLRERRKNNKTYTINDVSFSKQPCFIEKYVMINYLSEGRVAENDDIDEAYISETDNVEIETAEYVTLLSEGAIPAEVDEKDSGILSIGSDQSEFLTFDTFQTVSGEAITHKEEKGMTLDNVPQTSNANLEELSHGIVVEKELYNRKECIESDNANKNFVTDEARVNIEFEPEEAAADIERIAIRDNIEADETAEQNRAVDISSDEDDECDDDDSIFGILTIYKQSGLHCELNKAAIDKDFGYRFFSLSTFYR